MNMRWHALRAFFLRPPVGAAGVFESISPSASTPLARAGWVHWLFRYGGWHFLLVAAVITYAPIPYKRPLPVAAITGVLAAYALYTTFLELTSRVRWLKYDTVAFRWVRLLVTSSAVSALVWLDPLAGSYFWFFYLLPALQAFIYFGRRGMAVVTTTIVVIYGTLSTGLLRSLAYEVDYLVIALNAAILLFASFVLAWLLHAAQALSRAASDRRQLEYLSALRRASQDVVTRLTLRDALQVTLEQGLRALSATGGSIMLWNLEAQELRVEAWVADGKVEDPKEHQRFRLGQGLAGTVAQTGDLINTPDVRLDRRYEVSLTGRPIRAMLVVPIRSERHVMGTISVDSREVGVFGREEEQFLAALGDYLAIAVEAHHLRSINTALATLRVDSVLDTIVKTAAALTGADSATLFLRKPNLRDLERKARFPHRPDAEPPRGTGGLTQFVLDTGEDIAIDDAQLDRRVRKSVRESGVRSVLGVPLRTRSASGTDTIIGVLFVNAQRGSLFSARDKQLLRGLAGQAAIAIDNSRLFTDSEWRASQLVTLHEVAESLHSELQLPTLLDLISGSACRLLGGDSAAILLIDETRDHLRVKGHYKLLAETVHGTHIRIGDGIAGLVVKEGRHIIANDVATDLRATSQYLKQERILSMVTVPLRLPGGATIGTLGVHSRLTTGAFDERHAEILLLLAGQAAAAIGNAGALNRAREEASTLESLYRASVELTRHKSVPELMQSILLTAVQTLKSEGGGLYLSDIYSSYPTTVLPQCTLVAVEGLPQEEKGRLIALDNDANTDVVGTVIHLGEPFSRTWDERGEGRMKDFDRYGVRAMAAAPIRLLGKTRGALAVHSTNANRSYSAEDMNVLSLLGTFASVALENAKRTDDYDRLFKSTLDAIIAVDEHGIIDTANLQAERLLGYPDGGLVGMQVKRFYADPTERFRIWTRLIESPEGRFEDHQTYVRGAGGERIPISLSASLLYDYEKKRVGSVGFFRDLRAIKSAQREIGLLQNVLSASTAITQLGDPGDVLQAIVENTVKAMGAMRVVLWRYAEGRIQSADMVSCSAGSPDGPPPDLELPQELLTQIVSSSGVRTSDDAGGGQAPGGAWLGCRLTVGDEPIGVMVCWYDVTHTFTEREQTVFRLFADVAAIALNNADQANELETVAWTSALASWQAILAHDVHREAGAIRRGLRILHERTDLPGEVKDRLNELDSYTQALVLPTDKGPEIAAHPVDCIQHELGIARRLWPSITWRLEQPGNLPKVRVSPWWLRRIVKQLLRNAAEAIGSRDGWPRRDVTVTLRGHANLVTCEIQDTGPGFDKRLEPLLFRRLIRRDGGKGWGLVQVNSTLKECGGSAHILWNDPAKGACFELRFPTIN
jgi:PAS domain S-box-containing protein